MNPKILILLSLSAFLSLSCQNSLKGHQNNQGMISVSGKFPAAPAAKSAVAGQSSRAAFDPSLIAKVAAFCGTDGYIRKWTAGRTKVQRL